MVNDRITYRSNRIANGCFIHTNNIMNIWVFFSSLLKKGNEKNEQIIYALKSNIPNEIFRMDQDKQKNGSKSQSAKIWCWIIISYQQFHAHTNEISGICLISQSNYTIPTNLQCFHYSFDDKSIAKTQLNQFDPLIFHRKKGNFKIFICFYQKNNKPYSFLFSSFW